MEKKPELLSVAAAAKRLGYSSPATLYRHMGLGQLGDFVIREPGKPAKIRWEGLADHFRLTLGPPKSTLENLPPAEEISYAEARRRKEAALARLNELELAHRRGELVAVEKVKADAFTCGRTVREALFGLPGRIAAALAALDNPTEVHQLLMLEIRGALTELCHE